MLGLKYRLESSEDNLSFAFEDLHALYLYWLGKKSGRKMPSRPDIDPVQMKRHLPHVFLLDVNSENPNQWAFRLVGTELMLAFGRDMTRKTLGELYTDPLLGRLAIQRFEDVVITGKPDVIIERTQDAQGRPSEYERLLLPLSRDGVNVDMIFGAKRYFTRGYYGFGSFT